MHSFKFFQKNVLIISPEEWNHINVSKHHYAQILASRNNIVYFLNPPDNNINGISHKKIADNLFVIDYSNLYRGVRFFPKVVLRYLNKSLYNKIQCAAETRFDIVFLFENSRFYDLNFLPREVLSIYFQVDESQNFHPHIAAKSADVVIAINSIIQDILSQSRQKVFKIPHGFSGHFSENALRIYRGDKTYKKPDGRIKAFYVGNLDNNFCDVNTIASLVSEKQDVDFTFIGPCSKAGKLYGLIKDCKNVSLYGKAPAHSIPQLLDEADLLFFVYTEEFVSSSHKVMEYLASGKAIVTTSVKGYPEDPDLFYCSGTSDKLIDLFSKVCANIEEANSPGKMKKRIQFAMDNTYERRIGQIEELINQACSNKLKQ